MKPKMILKKDFPPCAAMSYRCGNEWTGRGPVGNAFIIIYAKIKE